MSKDCTRKWRFLFWPARGSSSTGRLSHRPSQHQKANKERTLRKAFKKLVAYIKQYRGESISFAGWERLFTFSSEIVMRIIISANAIVLNLQRLCRHMTQPRSNNSKPKPLMKLISLPGHVLNSIVDCLHHFVCVVRDPRKLCDSCNGNNIRIVSSHHCTNKVWFCQSL